MKAFYKVFAGSLLASICFFTACKTSQLASLPADFPKFFKEGHRGTRGLMPENTIPAMKKGIALGANVIEVDVYTSKDGQVLVAHDPTINRSHSFLPNGQEIPEADAKKYILHQMDYAAIRKFDVGSKYYSAFPQQKKIKTYIPLLGELIDSVEQFTAQNNLPGVIYNIELKTKPSYDNTYNSLPAELVDKVMDVVKSRSIGSRFYIQSFDIRPLQYIHKKYPKVVIGYLTDSKETFEQQIETLGFYPHIYSPHYRLADKALAEKCHEHHLKLVPWTVNSVKDMQAMLNIGVDGIITDYPNYFAHLSL